MSVSAAAHTIGMQMGNKDRLDLRQLRLGVHRAAKELALRALATVAGSASQRTPSRHAYRFLPAGYVSAYAYLE